VISTQNFKKSKSISSLTPNTFMGHLEGGESLVGSSDPFWELLSNANPIARVCLWVICGRNFGVRDSLAIQLHGLPPCSYHKMPASPKEVDPWGAGGRGRRRRRLRSVAYLLRSCQLIISLLAHHKSTESVSCDDGSVCVSALKKKKQSSLYQT